VSRRYVSPPVPVRGLALALDALGLCALKLAVGGWVLWRGFTHVSDDDYARTVIAEQFAHAWRLDPSGTSWLPLPFWLEGAAMAIAGRSLGVARAVAMVLGAASVAAPYPAMRLALVPRAAAVIATGVAMLLPWNAWLDVATVPEGWAGALVAAAAIAMGTSRMRPWAAAALLAASLSRYEAWPACAVMALLCAWHATRAAGSEGLTADRGGRRCTVRREITCALVAAAGPLVWVAWNAHAHGSPTHFLARVSAFRHAVGAADVPMRGKLLGYPSALVLETPEAAVLGIAGAVAMVASAAVRARWKWPAVVALAIVAFLVLGDIRDGAPTHHAARALAAVWWILIGMGVDAVVTLIRRLAPDGPWRLAAWGGATVAAIAWCAWLPSRWDASPGRTESERRDTQIARGLDLRARGVAHAWITPCAFEHFALIAAWGEPERAEVGMRTGATLAEGCPRVVEP
jgi:hypothetical protein